MCSWTAWLSGQTQCASPKHPLIICWSKRRNDPGELNLHKHCCEKLKYLLSFVILMTRTRQGKVKELEEMIKNSIIFYENIRPYQFYTPCFIILTCSIYLFPPLFYGNRRFSTAIRNHPMHSLHIFQRQITAFPYSF